MEVVLVVVDALGGAREGEDPVDAESESEGEDELLMLGDACAVDEGVCMVVNEGFEGVTEKNPVLVPSGDAVKVSMPLGTGDTEGDMDGVVESKGVKDSTGVKVRDEEMLELGDKEPITRVGEGWGDIDAEEEEEEEEEAAMDSRDDDVGDTVCVPIVVRVPPPTHPMEGI